MKKYKVEWESWAEGCFYDDIVVEAESTEEAKEIAYKEASKILNNMDFEDFVSWDVETGNVEEVIDNSQGNSNVNN